MAARSCSTVPSHRLYKRTGRAVVIIDGRDIALGSYGSGTSREAYNGIAAELLANGGRMDVSGTLQN
jgi:hypothetical protein